MVQSPTTNAALPSSVSRFLPIPLFGKGDKGLKKGKETTKLVSYIEQSLIPLLAGPYINQIQHQGLHEIPNL
jgi:hypothetical protein